MESVAVLDRGLLHPGDEGVVGDVVEQGQVGFVEFLDEFGDEFAAGAGDVEFVLFGFVVPDGLCVFEGCAELVGEVGEFAVGGIETVNDSLNKFDSFGGNGAVGGRCERLGRSHSWCNGNDTVVFVAVTLDLTPALTTTH